MVRSEKNSDIRKIDGGVTAAKGYLAAGVACGIKKSGGKDIALISSEPEAKAFGMFTTSVVKAAPVVVSMRQVAAKNIGGVVVSSGNANACTGREGVAASEKMCVWAAAATGNPDTTMLVASTGVIGAHLPLEKVEIGIKQAGELLSRDGGSAAEAIMTTDTVVKQGAIEFAVGQKIIRIGGMAKGVGMIAPNMATMIAVVTTDADICAQALEAATRGAVESSFNCITIDGDMSTNDTVFVLANGAAGNTPILQNTKDEAIFREGLTMLLSDLAEQMVRDGEEATKFVRVSVTGADCHETAKAVAMKVADSVLVKCALFGEDANWGRIAAAAGAAGVEFDPDLLDISLNGLIIMRDGGAAAEDQEAVDQVMRAKDIEIVLDLKAGAAMASVLTTDLSVEYVKFNAHYRT